MRMWASLVVLAMGLISISLKQMDYLNGYASFWTTTWDALPPQYTDNASSNQSVEMAAFIEPKDGSIKSYHCWVSVIPVHAGLIFAATVGRYYHSIDRTTRAMPIIDVAYNANHDDLCLALMSSTMILHQVPTSIVDGEGR